MPNKRLTFEVTEELHSRLKAEAAAKGVSLGSHCSAILEAGGVQPSSSIEELDATTISSMTLASLRETNLSLTKDRPKNWKRGVNLINTEIRRRFRV
jgi:hypothetical protein